MGTSVLEKPADEASESHTGSSPSLSELVTSVVHEEMKARGISVYRLIKMTGLGESRTYRIFSGGHVITLDELLVVSLALGIKPASLIAKAERRYDEAAR